VAIRIYSGRRAGKMCRSSCMPCLIRTPEENLSLWVGQFVCLARQDWLDSRNISSRRMCWGFWHVQPSHLPGQCLSQPFILPPPWLLFARSASIEFRPCNASLDAKSWMESSLSYLVGRNLQGAAALENCTAWQHWPGPVMCRIWGPRATRAINYARLLPLVNVETLLRGTGEAF